MNGLGKILARIRTATAVGLATALLASCTSMHPVPRADYSQLATKLKPGDHVTCTLRDGGEMSFTVTKVEADALVGKKHRVPISEIVRLEVKRFSVGKTFWLVVGIAAAGLMAEGIASMGSLGIPATSSP